MKSGCANHGTWFWMSRKQELDVKKDRRGRRFQHSHILMQTLNIRSKCIKLSFYQDNIRQLAFCQTAIFKLLRNFHTVANENFDEAWGRKKEKSHGHTHLNSQAAISRSISNKKKKVRFIGPQPTLLIFCMLVATHA